MATTVREIMTAGAVTLDEDAKLAEAARAMQREDIGDVLVRRPQGDLCGIVTDRDIVVRAIADGRDPESTALGDVCTHELRTVSPDDDLDAVIGLMREHTVRRVPVVDDGEPVGFVSIADLAVERDPDSLLGLLSAAPSDHR